MANVTDIDIWRDGGTIVFSISDSRIDGWYRLRSPVFGVPEPLFREGVQLSLGSTEELAVLLTLEEWMKSSLTEEISEAIVELDAMPLWLNLPERLNAAVPFHRMRTVILRLRDAIRLQSLRTT